MIEAYKLLSFLSKINNLIYYIYTERKTKDAQQSGNNCGSKYE